MPLVMSLCAGTKIRGKDRNYVIIEKIEGGDGMITTYDKPAMLGATRIAGTDEVTVIPHAVELGHLCELLNLVLGTPFVIVGQEMGCQDVFIATDYDERYIYVYLLGHANVMYRFPFTLYVEAVPDIKPF